MGKIIKAEKRGGIESNVIEEYTPLFMRGETSPILFYIFETVFI